MASRQRIFLPRFDPAAEFVILRSFKVNGVLCEPGSAGSPSPFDKGLVNGRRLRQLFEWRRIGLAGAPAKRQSGLAALNIAQAGADAALTQINRSRFEGDAAKAAAEERKRVHDINLVRAARGMPPLPLPPLPQKSFAPVRHVNGKPPPDPELIYEEHGGPIIDVDEADAPAEIREPDEEVLDLDVAPKAAHPAKSGDNHRRQRRKAPKKAKPKGRRKR